MRTKWNRYFTTITAAEGKKVVGLDLKLVGEDFTGEIWFTDNMVQGGEFITGHVPHTMEMHKRRRLRDDIAPPPYFNAVVRSNKTIVVPNLGEVTSAFDVNLEMVERVPKGTLSVRHGYDTRKFIIDETLSAGDEYKIEASTSTAYLNGQPTDKYDGAFLQVAAGDSKFQIQQEKGSSVKILAEFVEWDRGMGGERL